VEQTVVRSGNVNYPAMGRLCQITRRIKNRTHYLIRHQKKEDGKAFSHSDADKFIKRNEPQLYQKHPSAISQRTTQIAGEEWSSFFKALKAYKKTPDKFTAKPREPNYARFATTTYIGRNGFTVKKGWIHFPKQTGLSPIPTGRCVDQAYNAKTKDTIIAEIRLVPKGNCFAIEVVYDHDKCHENGTYCPVLKKSNVLGIDIGLDNLAALVSNQPDLRPVLINGKVIKSINARYNQQIAELRSAKKGGHIPAKADKRQHQIKDYLHKTSRFVIDYCVTHDIGTLVIGKNVQWKTGINIGKVNNQNFVSIPHAQLIDQITYKAKEIGIHVIIQEEAYTSKASALDNDDLPAYQPGIAHIFSGRRVKRGLYKASDGKKLNADVNGAINIVRKALGHEEIPLANRGCVFQPVRCSMHRTDASSVRRTKRISSCRMQQKAA
jgi:putative transposase